MTNNGGDNSNENIKNKREIYKEIKKEMVDLSIPEFPFLIPNEVIEDPSSEIKEKFKELENVILNEVAADYGPNTPFIADTFFSGQKCDLNKIEKLLRPFKAASLSEEIKGLKYKQEASSFRTAANSTIKKNTQSHSTQSSNINKRSENQSNEGGNANLDDHIIERVKNEIVETAFNLSWDDIVGLELVKKSINEIIVWPMLRPDLFTGIRKPIKGILLFGPPGTGKTMIGKCIASQAKATFFSISASSLTSKWVGEGEKMVRALFYLARQMAPSVIFIDEIDSLLSQRSENENEGSRRIKTEFLVQFDGVSSDDTKQILIIGATNRPQEIDEAAIRRLVKRILVPLPDQFARVAMLRKLLKDLKNEISVDQINDISKITEGYSGSDIYNLTREAAYEPLRDIEDIGTFDSEATRGINLMDFIKASKQIRKSVSNKDLDLFEKWNENFGSMI